MIESDGLECRFTFLHAVNLRRIDCCEVDRCVRCRSIIPVRVDHRINVFLRTLAGLGLIRSRNSVIRLELLTGFQAVI